jgi:hypothetical protein
MAKIGMRVEMIEGKHIETLAIQIQRKMHTRTFPS